MFHWICPECGQEIPPAVKACPACEPAVCEKQAEPEPAPALAAPPADPEPAVVLAASAVPDPAPSAAPITFADRLTALAEQLHAGKLPLEAKPKDPEVSVPASAQVIEIPVIPLLAPPPSRALLAEPAPPAMAPPLDHDFEIEIAGAGA